MKPQIVNQIAEQERAGKPALGVMIALIMAWASPFAKADLIVTPVAGSVAVTEGDPGELSWTIQNNGKSAVTLNNDFRVRVPDFMWTGGDKDDDPLRGSIGGCDNGVTLAAEGGQCVLTVPFTTPVPDAGDETRDENKDRGFWDLLNTVSGSKGEFGTVDGTLRDGTLVISQLVVGHVEVDDPGVKPIIPEPSSLLLLGSGLLGLGGVLHKRQSRPR